MARSEVGVTGLDQILADLYAEGWQPDQEKLAKTLLERLRLAGNYITPGEEQAYEHVLAELYRHYFAEPQLTKRAA